MVTERVLVDVKERGSALTVRSLQGVEGGIDHIGRATDNLSLPFLSSAISAGLLSGSLLSVGENSAGGRQALNRMQGSLDGIANTVFQKTAPALEEVNRQLSSLPPFVQTGISLTGAFSGFGATILGALGFISLFGGGLGRGISHIGGFISKGLSPLFANFRRGGRLVNLAYKGIDRFGKLVLTIPTGFGSAFGALGRLFTSIRGIGSAASFAGGLVRIAGLGIAGLGAAAGISAGAIGAVAAVVAALAFVVADLYFEWGLVESFIVGPLLSAFDRLKGTFLRFVPAVYPMVAIANILYSAWLALGSLMRGDVSGAVGHLDRSILRFLPGFQLLRSGALLAYGLFYNLFQIFRSVGGALSNTIGGALDFISRQLAKLGIEWNVSWQGFGGAIAPVIEAVRALTGFIGNIPIPSLSLEKRSYELFGQKLDYQVPVVTTQPLSSFISSPNTTPAFLDSSQSLLGRELGSHVSNAEILGNTNGASGAQTIQYFENYDINIDRSYGSQQIADEIIDAINRSPSRRNRLNTGSRTK